MRYISTLNLIELIVSRSDRDALNELLSNRRLFYSNKRRLLLSEFLWILREGYLKKSVSVALSEDLAEFSYDLTLDKFTNLPQQTKTTEYSKKSNHKLKQRQVDCRNYYGAVLTIMNNWKEKNPNHSAIDEEQTICDVLQRMVVKHFNLSRLEFLRNKREFAICYNWKVEDKVVKLWYPIELDAKVFREWLENEKSDVVVDVKEERDRLQSRIDASFFNNRILSIEDHNVVASNPGHVEVSNNLKVSGLANIVASEKIGHFDRLRPAIRKLGKPTLEQLIIRIFDDLSEEVFEDQVIASDFGLSRSTFSRFAGSHWGDNSESGEKSSIPDLWHNTARVLGSNHVWLEIAEEAGVMRAVKDILKKSGNEVKNE